MTATTEDILSEDVALAETAPTNGAVVEGTATDASLTELTETSTSDASVIKTFGTEFYLEAFRLLMEILGPSAYLERHSVGSVLKGRLEGNYRSLLILTFGGGTNEIQRDLIGMFGMGLPRAIRS